MIGGGLAGLMCAGSLAREGLKVLVLEKNQRLGGYTVSYEVSGHRFDIAIQAIGGCHPGGPVDRGLEEIGQQGEVKFLPCEPARVYYTGNPGSPWIQSGFQENILQSLCSRFPSQCESLRECYDIWSGILEELERIGHQGPENPAFAFTRSYPLLARYGRYTLEEFLEELGLPKGLQLLVSARSGYCMLPPERLSLVGFACTEMTFSKGSWLVEGGIERLSQAFARGVTEHGGRIIRGVKAGSIVTEGGRVRGVRACHGNFYPGDNVVVAAAARPALEGMLDTPELLPPRYRRRLASMEPTGSYYVAYYSVPSPAVEGLWPNMEIRGDGDLEADGVPGGVFYVLIPSLVDRTAAPEGSHCLCLSLPCPPGRFLGREGRCRFRECIEHAVERRFPQLKGRLRFLFELSPEQLELISGNPAGSAYGWAQIPEQSGIRRLNIKTPLPGLYLSGHWTMPGGGIAGVVTSGRLCAQAVLDQRSGLE